MGLNRFHIPAIVLAALRGGAGKTLISVGLAAAIKKKGLRISVFKKGPDYIDSGWLGMSVAADCYNLDAYLMPESTIITSFVNRSRGCDLSIIEGNRGLFDGVDAKGKYSTAELAKLLQSPVILIVDAAKMTRTAAALVLGSKMLDPEIALKAIILNRVAGHRHESVLRDSIESATGIPVVGSIPKLALESFPQRHLGLLPLYEHPAAEDFIARASKTIEEFVDLEEVIRIAGCSGTLHHSSEQKLYPTVPQAQPRKIGILKDSAFQFYYPENLEALRAAGADLVFLSAISDSHIPDNVDALYIGGGFPETHAEKLASNISFRSSLKRRAELGMPVYAECGGLMYLSNELRIDLNVYPMVGVFPISTVLERKPQGHGYIEVEVTTGNPFYSIGQKITGHEFHYSYVTGLDTQFADYCFKVTRGHGMGGGLDGISRFNCLGTYVHVHSLGMPEWASGILKSADWEGNSRD